MIEIRELRTEEDINYCASAILAFRDQLPSAELIEKTLKMMREGFRIAFIPNDTDNYAAAFIGFRCYEMYRTGKIIYIDDIFTFPAYRSRGYAGALLDHVDEIAIEMNVESVHLDSGYTLHPAHRLYLNKGFVLPCHHFSRNIKSGH